MFLRTITRIEKQNFGDQLSILSRAGEAGESGTKASRCRDGGEEDPEYEVGGSRVPLWDHPTVGWIPRQN